MKQLISTDDVNKMDRPTYWREAISSAFVELDCSTTHNKDFHGFIATQNLSHARLDKVTSSRQHVKRTKSLISNSNSDLFLLSLQLKGVGMVMQNGRRAVLHAGDFALYDTAQQYELIFEKSFSQIVLQIPRKMIKKYLGVPEKLTALKLDHQTACGFITGQTIQNLYQQGQNLSSEQQDILLISLMESLKANFSDQNLDIARDISTTRYTRTMMIKNFILNNLTNYHLCPQIIADEFNISTRYLGKLFAEEGNSISKWIYQKRLERCKTDMLSPLLRGLTISEIAYKWGFNDTSHFSRRFKAKYKISPRAYRQIYLKS